MRPQETQMPFFTAFIVELVLIQPNSDQFFVAYGHLRHSTGQAFAPVFCLCVWRDIHASSLYESFLTPRTDNYGRS